LVSSSTISIVTPDINTHPVLEIIDTYGRSVFRSDIHNGQITFHRNGLAPGLYLVLIMNEGKVIGTEKMIVR
jgi:hypothetical protein